MLLEELALFLKVFLITILFTSALLKAYSYKDFINTLEQLKFRKIYARVISILILTYEMTIAILLMFRKMIIAEVMLITLLIMFSFGVIRARKIGKKIRCNCFGKLTDEFFGLNTIFHILVMLTATVILYLNNDLLLSNSSFFNYIMSVLTSLGIILIYALINQLFKYKVME